MNENGQQVQVEESCYKNNLGVHIYNHYLKFKKQIETAINKANSKLRMICRSFKILLAFYKNTCNDIPVHIARLPIWCLDMLQAVSLYYFYYNYNYNYYYHHLLGRIHCSHC